MAGKSPYRRLIPPVALWLAATALALPGVLRALDWAGLPPEVEGHLVELSAAASWLSAAWFGARLFRIVVSGGERPVPRLLGDMVAIALFVAAVIVVLGSVFHQPVGALVTTSGVVVAVLGFSLREFIADIFAGVCINMERPYALGDWLEVPPANQAGKVVEINWRATRMVTLDGVTVVVPNGLMARSKFLNFSAPRRSFRVCAAVTLDFDLPVERARRLMAVAVRSTTGVLPEPAPDIQVEGFFDHGVRYLVRFWVPDYEPMVAIRGEVLTNVHRHLRLGGVPLRHGRQDLTIARVATEAPDLDGRRVSVLRHVELFRALTVEDLELLSRDLTVRHDAAGSVIVLAGDTGGSLFVVVEGLLEVRGERGVLASLGPGDVFGEMSFLTGAPRSATVVAATEAVLFEIFDRQVRPILHCRPDLAEALGAIIEERQHANQKRMEGDVLAASASPGQPVLLARIREWFGLG